MRMADTARSGDNSRRARGNEGVCDMAGTRAGSWLIPLLLIGIAGANAGPPRDPTAERAAALLAPLKQNLKSALLAALEQGPEHAVSVCKEQAPAIARSLSVDGVILGRSSHRLRNPANAPPAWVAPVIEAWLADGASREPVSVELEDGRSGYVEPIVMQPLCTTCHGSAIPRALAERIAADYPQDRATGFAIGELRGVYWVELTPTADESD